ncbi:MAG TPA: response regulator transcription factor [Dehalococcoidia bacterium]|nr:response regulator transcription factor [Dehalococcoidia bacterium]
MKDLELPQVAGITELPPPHGAAAAGEPIGVGVVSPYPSVRAGLRVLLHADAGLEVLSEASSLESLAAARLDVLVADLPALEVLEWFGPEVEEHTAAAVVLLGPAPDDARVLARLAPRPWGYLPREVDAAELVMAVRTVHAGLSVLHPALAPGLFLPAVGVRSAPAGEGVEELTARELEVLALLAEGIPNKAIARRLGISDHTVKFHVGSVLSKLDAASRTEAVRIGARRGLIAL